MSSDDAGLAPTVLSYYAYKATKAVELYRPVMYLYFLSQGLSFAQIAAMEAAYNVTTVVGEVPTGYVGDRFGRRASLLLGTVLIALTLVGLGLAESFPALLGLYVLWSTGYNFRSGSEDAWLYDALVDGDEAGDFAQVRGRGESAALLVGVVGSVAGGYLASVSLSYPFFAAAAVTSLGVPILLVADESETYREESDAVTFREVTGVVRDALSRPGLRAFVPYYYVLFSAVSYLVFIFLQPVFEAVVVGEIGVAASQVEPLLGWYYAAISLLGAAVSYNAGAVESRIGLRRWFLALPFVVGGLLLVLPFAPLLALPALLVVRAVGESTRALASSYVNDRVETLGRATVLSALAMVSALAVVPFQLGSGVLSDASSPTVALAVAGGVLIFGSVLILLWHPPVTPVAEVASETSGEAGD